jgi:NhaP-type Na+/H+ and K+/H+ antiporter
MRIKMKAWEGVTINPDYITKMVRDCITQVTTDEGSEPLAYALTGNTLVLAVNEVIAGESFPEVYVCKIVRYGCPAKDEIEIID